LCTFAVALRKESVDRNASFNTTAGTLFRVALRKESVDRNIQVILMDPYYIQVALRKESVDRNLCPLLMFWLFRHVALRKESVDRNILSTTLLIMPMMSLSARRAWIEILNAATLRLWTCRRSPQGERG